MNLKNFLIASLIIHIMGAIALYFYYNPITSAPKPVRTLENEEKPAQNPTKEFTESSDLKNSVPTKNERKKKKTNFSVKTKAVSQNKRHTNVQTWESKSKKKKIPQKQDIVSAKETFSQEEKNPAQQTDPDLKNSKTDLVPTQQQALSEAKAPATDIKEPSIETIDSPIKLDLQEIDIENKNTKEVEGTDDPPVLDLQEEKAEENQNIKETKPTDDFPIETKLLEAEAEKNLNSKIKTSVANKENIKNIDEQKDFDESLKTENNFDQNTLTPEQKSNNSSGKQIKNFQDLKQKMGNMPLDYPDFARRTKMEGTVSVLFFVTQQGLVEQIQLESSSGHSELDNFVLRRLSRYEFLPGQETWVRHNISFTLKGEEMEPLTRKEKN